jgi:hypothetical protein
MVSVSASASRYGIAERRASVSPAGALGVIVLAALALALVAPLDVFVFGLLLIGVTHVVFELRYVIGRFPAITRGHVAIIVQVVLVAIALGRLAGSPVGARGEILGWGVLLVAAVLAFTRGAPGVRAGGLALVTAATATAYAWPDTWLVVQVHLHNLIPAAFVWDWANHSLTGRARTAVRAVTVGWVTVVPVALLTGVVVSVRDGTTIAAHAVSQTSALNSVTPPAWRSGVLPDRLLAAFAFAQLVHYGVWCLFLPRYAPDVTRSFDATAPGRWLRGKRLALAALAGTALVAGFGAVDYSQGKTLYTAFGAYHAYLEFPVLAAMGAVWARRRREGSFDALR